MTDTSQTVIPASDVQEIVSALAGKIRALYVLKGEVAEQIAVAVESGSYDNLTGEALAKALTDNMRSINGDKHLSVAYDASHPTPEEPPVQIKKYNEDGQEVDEQGNVVQEVPPPGFFDMFKEMMANQGNGVTGVEVLPGNVGCLTLSYFAPEELSTPFFQYAMSLVQHTNALIIDIRHNGGGDSSTPLLSYFLSDRVHYKNIYWRPEDRTVKDYSYETVPGPRYNTNKEGDRKRPVYIVTSTETFSSAEAFAFFMRELKLGQTVGETTAGGGHPCKFVRCGNDAFKASISIGYSYSPVTGNGWQKVGVPADVACSAADAKDTAHLLGCQVTLDLLQAVAPGQMSPAKGMLRKKTEAAVKELQEKIEKRKQEAAVAAAAPPSEVTPSGFSLSIKDGKAEELPAGIHTVQNSDGTVTTIQVKETKFLGIKFRTQQEIKTAAAAPAAQQ